MTTTVRIRFTKVVRGRGREYAADLELDDQRVGRVERAWSMGGMRAKDYRAIIAGTIVATGETLAELRAELREHFAHEYADARESW